MSFLDGNLGDLVGDLVGSGWSGLKGWLFDLAKDNAYLLFLVVYSVVRATGVTVQSGTHGLLFSFGRARKVIDPGFRMLIPFLQVVRAVPTRQRTMDLPSQRVTTIDGLVYFVDANLVYRIVDVKKALIEIDDLLHGMRQMLVLSVQEVLRKAERASFHDRSSLDNELTAAMARRLVAWGVEVERAGFTSITPSPKTLRLTQLAQRVGERRTGLEILEHGAPRPMALALLGTGQRVITRARLGRERAIERKARRRVERMFRRAAPTLRELDFDAQTRKRLRRELLADAGLSGVLGDAGFGDDAPAKAVDAPARPARRDSGTRPKTARKASGGMRRNPTRVRKSPTGR